MEPIQPRRGYIICTEPRSGSSFLCQLLQSTDSLGYPREYIAHPAHWQRQGEPDYPRDLAGQIGMVLSRGATPNGVYAVKLFGWMYDAVSGTDWQARLPGLHFIHLEREDLLGQAISDWRATQTGQFSSNRAPAGKAEYDRRAIARRIAVFAHHQARWRRWFARNDIRPLRLTYEGVAADPQAAVDRVATLIGVNEPVPVDFSRVSLRRQSDEMSAQWRARFVAEAGDLSFLDEDPLRRLRRRLAPLRAMLPGIRR